LLPTGLFGQVVRLAFQDLGQDVGDLCYTFHTFVCWLLGSFFPSVQ
jgi:hypothetical protein